MRLILFDCDGTIIDSQQAIITGMTRAMVEVGLEPAADADILKSIGLSLEAAVELYLPDSSEAQRAALIDAYKTIATEIAAQEDRGEAVFPGMAGLLHDLAAEEETLLGMVTMKSRRGVHRVCKTHGFEEVFHVLKSADDGPGKPNPQLILDAMDELGVTADQTMMIGDTVYDMAMAANAGVLPIGVSWGYNPVTDLRKFGAQHIVQSAEDLLSLLKNNNL
ncbi:MAG: HAD-IA family hydrolase [Parvibaculales bacterium]